MRVVVKLVQASVRRAASIDPDAPDTTQSSTLDDGCGAHRGVA